MPGLPYLHMKDRPFDSGVAPPELPQEASDLLGRSFLGSPGPLIGLRSQPYRRVGQ